MSKLYGTTIGKKEYEPLLNKIQVCERHFVLVDNHIKGLKVLIDKELDGLQV